MVSANPYIHKESFVLKMLVISVIWFYMAFPHLSSAVDHGWFLNYLIFFLMILGNTFTLGAVKRIVARLHSLHSRPYAYRHSGGHHACWEQFNKKVALLVGVEIILSVILVGILGRRQKQQSQV